MVYFLPQDGPGRPFELYGEYVYIVNDCIRISLRAQFQAIEVIGRLIFIAYRERCMRGRSPIKEMVEPINRISEIEAAVVIEVCGFQAANRRCCQRLEELTQTGDHV